MEKRLKSFNKNINKIKIRIAFKIKTGYYLKHLTSEIMKLLGSTKNKIYLKMKMVKMCLS